MAIIASKTSGSTFTPHPEGQFAAVCVDVVDLGIIETTFKGVKKRKHKIDIYFFCGEWKETEDGRRFPLTVRERFTLTLSEMGNLRPFLEAWRGKRFTPEEEEGFDVEKLLHAPALITVSHNESNGNTYANVVSCTKLPKAMLHEAPDEPADYVRMKDRVKEEDAPNGNGQPSPFDDDPDSDLPF